MPPPKRDHTSLICDIGELTDLFADTRTLENFLQKIVEMVADHMRADVCSIYLYYQDKGELVLKANKGLKPSAIGKVKLKLGEGLTGLAVQELRPICERMASQNPHYRYFPEIGEELYESFLVAPIMRGQNRIGALVVQNVQRNAFSEQDVPAVRAIASQLANTIETAKLLMDLNKRSRIKEDQSQLPVLKFIKGRVGSEGFAFAPAVVADYGQPFERFKDEKYSKICTLKDFHRAVEVSEKQLEGLQKEIESKLSDVASLIFTAQILMLKDQAFIDAIVALIQKNVTPPLAVIRTVENYMKIFEQLPTEYLREKKQDVKDVGMRLLENLLGPLPEKMDYQGRIVIARELYPSDILKLSSQGIKGLVLLSGGISSHLSILSRSLEIPLVIADEQRLLRLPEATQVLLDAEQGNIYITPDQEVIGAFKKKEEDKKRVLQHGSAIKEETLTRDGARVKLLANINLLADVKIAQACKSEGVGLYRTEFPFIVRANFPSEEEQLVVYKKLVDTMRGKEIIFRTLDIGGDKVLSYYDYGKEENPFLGMRSIRFSLRHKDVFVQQLRAILRAGVNADLNIMFPMISSLDEFLEAKGLVAECVRQLKSDGVEHHAHPKVGMMVELPAVLEIIEALAQEADFFSIGTNDFIQYMLAVDRTNEKVADLYLPHHPSVLRALKRIVDAANAFKKDLSICGDMAHHEQYIPYFLGMGVRKISLDPRHHLRIQRVIQATDLAEAQKMTRKLLSQTKISVISKMIDG